MPRGVYEDLTGRRYGRLKVLGEMEGLRQGTHVVWRCRCRCGSITLVHTGNLTTGNTMSCGCLQREIAALPNRRRPAWRRELKEDDAGKNPLP